MCVCVRVIILHTHTHIVFVMRLAETQSRKATKRRRRDIRLWSPRPQTVYTTIYHANVQIVYDIIYPRGPIYIHMYIYKCVCEYVCVYTRFDVPFL